VDVGFWTTLIRLISANHNRPIIHRIYITTYIMIRRYTHSLHQNQPNLPLNPSTHLLLLFFEFPPSSRASTHPLREPDFPHSALILRVRPDIPEHSFHISSILFSGPLTPSNSLYTTSSVEFIDEILIPPLQSRQYYHYDPYQSLETLIT